MTVAHRQMIGRAVAWGENADEVAGLVLYGSLAQGHGRQWSDLDMVIVTRPGDRQATWDRRQEIATAILGQPVAWNHELDWQRPYRFQAWTMDLAAVDLTFDEGVAEASPTLANGYRVLVDKTDIAAALAAGLERLEPAGHDPNEFDASTWVWFLWLYGRLEHGRCWHVCTSLVHLIDTRLVPLFYDGPSYEVETRASADQLQRLHNAVPRSVDRGELQRALQATLLAYEEASMAWSRRTGIDVLRSPLADSIRRAVLSPT